MNIKSIKHRFKKWMLDKNMAAIIVVSIILAGLAIDITINSIW